jgi:RNA polymerase sigma factor for flagellar operon FliA
VTAPPSEEEDDLVLAARPFALRLARVLAGLAGARSPWLLDDCQQTACQALLEARPRYDKSKGPFWVFAWKRVAGAVTKLLRRELAGGRTGFDDALDESEDFRDTSDPFGDEDDDTVRQLKGMCRALTFRRVVGDARIAIQARPDDALLRAQIFQVLREALGGLDEREVRLVELRYWEELTWEGVGNEMGMSDRNAKEIHRRLRARLERDLQRRGVEGAPPSVHP